MSVKTRIKRALDADLRQLALVDTERVTQVNAKQQNWSRGEYLSRNTKSFSSIGNMTDMMRNTTGHQRENQRENLNAEVPWNVMNTRYKTVYHYTVHCKKLTLRNDLVRCKDHVPKLSCNGYKAQDRSPLVRC